MNEPIKQYTAGDAAKDADPNQKPGHCDSAPQIPAEDAAKTIPQPAKGDDDVMSQQEKRS